MLLEAHLLHCACTYCSLAWAQLNAEGAGVGNDVGAGVDRVGAGVDGVGAGVGAVATVGERVEEGSAPSVHPSLQLYPSPPHSRTAHFAQLVSELSGHFRSMRSKPKYRSLHPPHIA